MKKGKGGRPEPLSSGRLIEAAEAVLQAVKEVGEEYGDEVTVNLSKLIGSPAMPKCLAEFTKWEVDEGTHFLVRMGYLNKA